MTSHRFHLQKYVPGSKTACPKCGRKACFVRYVDEQGEVVFPEDVGRCDHEESCGYHRTPRDFFNDNPGMVGQIENQNIHYPQVARSLAPSFIDGSIVAKPQCGYGRNPLYRYFCSVFGKEETDRLFSLYSVGTSAKWGGATVFWQQDIDGKFRTGKIMAYNPENGHRIKEPFPCVGWAHTELRLPDFHLRQCLFGEHLLARHPDTQVMLVESEKTAIVCSRFMPEYVWLATGGKNGCFNAEAMSVLRGRNVTLFPDLGAYGQWQSKMPMLGHICRSASVSGCLETVATEEQRWA